ncbi:HAD family hydrolase [Marinobacter sp.]|uniref:HAD family hydrolase n=1 Tax=Marinobacter sp. TaxID=50741 RepID=UPI003564F8D4
MAKVYLFDWGDTLMVDFPGSSGKMCDWADVQAVEGAENTLAYLSAKAKIYVATGAAHSTVEDIQKAFRRVRLDRYISGYFCQSNVGMPKGSAEFLIGILQRLGVAAPEATMVGDSFEKDIAPALATGIQPVWLTTKAARAPEGVKIIRTLIELLH